jgi:Inner membrane protein YgaP-like, transmembrane domain
VIIDFLLCRIIAFDIKDSYRMLLVQGPHIMKKNFCGIDRFIRTILGISLIYIGFINNNFISDTFSSNILGIAGVLSLVVALFKKCPFYSLAGFNSCHHKNN